MPGRSVRLFLIDGTPQGMRTAEVGNWTGMAIVCPRTDLARLSKRPEVRRTGVYLLVGRSESSASGLSVYVGEGDEVWTRLSSHDDSKDFWTWVVVFVSKDENLTKSHVRWLEATIIREIRDAKRAELKNGNEPVGGKLPEADTADMETFFENVRLLLPTLGANVFAVEDAPSNVASGSTDAAWELKWEDAKAECVVRDGQFVVKKGSTARVKEVDSLGESTRNLRKTLKKTGVLAPVTGNDVLLRFTQDYAFDSPSAAAGVVAGTGLNGRANWKLKGQSVTYKEWQEKQVNVATEQGEAEAA
jgi:hypothetical protein